MAAKGRGLFREIWKNFVGSFSSAKNSLSAQIVGKDHFGNVYYESPANPQRGKRLSSRWYETKTKEDFQQEIPVEWEAWLRRRRNVVPTQEEINRNLKIVNLKKENAAELQDKHLKEKMAMNPEDIHEKTTPQSGPEFPKFDEYEIMPGEPQGKTKKQ